MRGTNEACALGLGAAANLCCCRYLADGRDLGSCSDSETKNPADTGWCACKCWYKQELLQVLGGWSQLGLLLMLRTQLMQLPHAEAFMRFAGGSPLQAQACAAAWQSAAPCASSAVQCLQDVWSCLPFELPSSSNLLQALGHKVVTGQAPVVHVCQLGRECLGEHAVADCLHERGAPTFWRHWATKSWNVKLQWSLSASWGGGSRPIRKMTRMGCTFHRGGCASAISIAEMPAAHTSTCSASTLARRSCIMQQDRHLDCLAPMAHAPQGYLYSSA